MATKLVVVSDVHVGAGELDNFDDELESHWVNFLNDIGSSPVELVINGDFLEFIQAPPWSGSLLESTSDVGGVSLCFTEEQSVDKFGAIAREHLPVFTSLREFLRSNLDNRITILPGNHDVDLFWPTVRSRLTDLICEGSSSLEGRLCILNDRVYRPDTCPSLWFEHGHQFDPINSFFVDEVERWSQTDPPILRDRDGVDRLISCVGTRFLLRFINQLCAEFPFVDNVKPFSLFVKFFASTIFDSPQASLKAALTVFRFLGFLGRTGLAEPSSLLRFEDDIDGPGKSLLDSIRRLNDLEPELASRLRHAGFNDDRHISLVLDDPESSQQLLLFIADHPELIEGLDSQETGYLSSGGAEGTLALAKGFGVDESAALVAGANEVLNRGAVQVVVMGHTHEALNRPNGTAYFNTGCWTRFYDHGTRTSPPPWALLKAGDYKDFPYRLQYVVVDTADPSSAALMTYRERVA